MFVQYIIIVVALGGALNKRLLYFTVGPWPARCLLLYSVHYCYYIIIRVYTYIDEKSDRSLIVNLQFVLLLLHIIHEHHVGIGMNDETAATTYIGKSGFIL